MDYARLVPLLVESIKEQQEMIRKQDAAIAELNTRMATFEAALRELQGTAAPQIGGEQEAAQPLGRLHSRESN